VEQIFVSGLAMGCIYALVALGFVLLVVAANIVNFAYGEWVMFGAYIGVTFVNAGVPLGLALIATIPACVLLGLGFQLVVFRPLEGRHFLSVIIATIGVGIAMQNAATLIWGPYALSMPPFFGAAPLSIAGATVAPHQLLIMGLTVALIAAFQLMLTRSPLGLRVQAAAQDREAAQLMGVRVRRMQALVAGIAAALAGIAGFLVAPLFTVSPLLGFALMLKGFAATIIGGWGSLKGAVVGGLALGLLESFAAAYISTAYKDAITFSVLIVVLLLVPRGLFGERVAVKV
jgi:branched-chain amino acid transport system permease protein